MGTARKDNNIPVIAICYILFFSFGIYNVLIGTQLPLYLEEFNLEISDGGIFNAITNIGCLFGMFLSGILLPRYNKRIQVILSYLLFGVFIILVGLTFGYIVMLILMFLIGVSSRFFDAAANAFIPVVATKNTGFFLNLLHTSYSAGNLAGPLIITFLLTQGMPWRNTYICVGVGFIVLLLLFYAVQYKTIPKNSDAPAAKTVVETIPYSKIFVPKIILLVVILFLFCGHQFGISNWYHTYVRFEMGQTESFASLALSIYWVGSMLSRFTCAFLSTRIKEETLIKVAGIAGAIFLSIGIFSGNSMIMIVCVGISALFSGCVIPLVVSCGFNVFPEANGKVSVLLFSVISAGAVILPWIMGSVSNQFGLHVGMIINVMCVIIMAVLSLGLKKAR